MIEPLDAPVKLHYNFGSYFPSNALIIGYVFVGIGLLISFALSLFGPILLIIGLLIVLTKYGTKIDLEKKIVCEYIAFFGFIHSQKNHDLANYLYICAIPSKRTSTMYSRSSNSTTNTDYFFSVSLLNVNYRNQLEIAQFDQRSEANDIAKRLGETLKKDYFDYDPKVIREKILGKR